MHGKMLGGDVSLSSGLFRDRFRNLCGRFIYKELTIRWNCIKGISRLTRVSRDRCGRKVGAGFLGMVRVIPPGLVDLSYDSLLQKEAIQPVWRHFRVQTNITFVRLTFGLMSFNLCVVHPPIENPLCTPMN